MLIRVDKRLIEILNFLGCPITWPLLRLAYDYRRNERNIENA